MRFGPGGELRHLRVALGDVHVHIARQEAVLVADHGGPRRGADGGQVRQRYLTLTLSAGGRDEHAAQGTYILPEIAQVADVDRVALPSLHRLVTFSPPMAFATTS